MVYWAKRRARGRDEVDEGEAGPSSGGLPEGGEAMAVGVFGAAEQRAGADPGTEQGEDEDEGGEGAAGDEVVGAGLDLAEAGERDSEQSEDDEGEDDGVEVHEGRMFCGGAAGSPAVVTTVYGALV